jgi:hypothetical protein
MSQIQSQFENPKVFRRVATIAESSQVAWVQAIVQNGGVIVGMASVADPSDNPVLDKVAIFFVLEEKGASQVTGQIDRDYIDLAD